MIIYRLRPVVMSHFSARLCRLLPKGRKSVGEGFGEWFEAPSYEEGVGVDGGTEGLPSEKEGSWTSQAAKPSGVIDHFM